MPRPTPFDLTYGPLADSRFPAIGRSLAETGRDPHDLDAFVLDREVVALLREQVPESGVGEAVNQHLALLHHTYLYWQEGGWLFRLTAEGTRRMLAVPAEPGGAPPRAFYAQFPERMLWADLGTGEAPEPLDGLFVRPWPGGGYFVLGIFGLHPGREGFTVVDTDGHPAPQLEREDGTAPFAPRLAAGEAAGLYSIEGQEELIELAARISALAGQVAQARGCTDAHQPITID